jgi:hypothetical protein
MPVDRTRSTHPDIDPDTGELKPDAWLDPRMRAEQRTLHDPAARAHMMSQVAREQAEFPRPVQAHVQGRYYDSQQAYLAERAWALQEWGRRQGFDRVVTDRDVADMSLHQYDELFDERGQPKPGVLLWRTSRSQLIDDGTDSSSQVELRNLRRPR